MPTPVQLESEKKRGRVERMTSVVSPESSVLSARGTFTQRHRLFSPLFVPGQLEFVSDTGRTDDSSKLQGGMTESLEIAAELLGLSTEELSGALLTRPLQVAREKFVKPNKVGEAQAARDALAKDVYLGIFNYLLKKINEATRRVYSH